MWEHAFRYAAIMPLVARIALEWYSRRASTGNGVNGRFEGGSALSFVIKQRRVRCADLILFTNLWATIALTFWVTAFLVGREHPFP